MVFSNPQPFIVCPSCLRVNFVPALTLPLEGEDAVELGRVACVGCQEILAFGTADLLPIRQPRNAYRKWGHGKVSGCFSIYLLVNKCNGLIYIGKTSQTLAQRMYLHECSCRNLKSNRTAIQLAMAEFGSHNFDMILLEESFFTLNTDRERDYISRLRACDPKRGYNRAGCRTVAEARAAYEEANRRHQLEWAALEKWPYD